MKKLLLLTAVLVMASSAHAGQRDFNKLDTNQDGKLSLEEFLVHIKTESVEKMTAIFHKRDKNEDGFLTQKEYIVEKQKA